MKESTSETPQRWKYLSDLPRLDCAAQSWQQPADKRAWARGAVSGWSSCLCVKVVTFVAHSSCLLVGESTSLSFTASLSFSLKPKTCFEKSPVCLCVILSRWCFDLFVCLVVCFQNVLFLDYLMHRFVIIIFRASVFLKVSPALNVVHGY